MVICAQTRTNKHTHTHQINKVIVENMNMRTLSDRVPILTSCTFDSTWSEFSNVAKAKDSRFLQFRFSDDVLISLRPSDVRMLCDCLGKHSRKDDDSSSLMNIDSMKKDNDLNDVSSSEKNEVKEDKENHGEEQELKRFVRTFATKEMGIKFVKQHEPIRNRILFVHSIVSGSEAERASVQKGDCVCTVNGVDTTGMNFSDAIALLQNTKRPFPVLFERHMSVKRVQPAPPSPPRPDAKVDVPLFLSVEMKLVQMMMTKQSIDVATESPVLSCSASCVAVCLDILSLSLSM